MGCAGSKSNDAVDTRGGGDGNPDEEDEYQPLTKEEVQQRIQASDGTLVYELGKTGVTMHYAYLSQRGYYPDDLYKQNQDSYKIVREFGGSDEMVLMGVFDGHGTDGGECSRFVRNGVAETLQRHIARRANTTALALTNTFTELDREMHLQQGFNDAYSGTTAIAILFRGRTMHIANVGDSRAMIAQRHGRKLVAYPLSSDQVRLSIARVNSMYLFITRSRPTRRRTGPTSASASRRRARRS